MLSRVADSLYWLGRYSERAYANAHIMSLQIDHMLEQNRSEKQYEQQWDTVLSICGYMDDYKLRYKGYDLEQMLYYLCNDKKNYNSIDSIVMNIRNNAKNSRDCIPNTLFEEWNSLYLTNNETLLEHPFTVLQANGYLENVRRTALTATGIIDSVMTRDDCFQFIKIGKWLERSEKTALIILDLMENEATVKLDFAVTLGLQLTNTFEEYSRRSRMRDADLVLNFLVNDTNCSRSVGYGLQKIKSTLFEMEQYKIRPYATNLFEAMEEIEQVLQQDAREMTSEQRKQWMTDIHTKCTQLGPIFSETYYLTAPILVK